MILHALRLAGVYRVEVEPIADSRGFFGRTWCEQEAAKVGISTRFVQSSVSYNRSRATLRGLHFQKAPYAEAKLVRCIRGEAFDVVVDLRPGSSTFGHWESVVLSGDKLDAVYIPEGFAHGFYTMTDDVLIQYEISVPYRAEASAGVRWNDQTIGIRWPGLPGVISERDAALPGLKEIAA